LKGKKSKQSISSLGIFIRKVQYNHTDYDSLSKILELMIILPVDSVMCERMFSIKNIIMRANRNCMKEINLNRRMNIRTYLKSFNSYKKEFIFLVMKKFNDIKRKIFD